MTISNPPLPADPLVPVAAAAPATDPVSVCPTDGFDQLMAMGEPAVAAQPADPAGDAPVNEQAAVLAASLLWVPLPLLVAPPPPTVPETIASAPGTPDATAGVSDLPAEPMESTNTEEVVVESAAASLENTSCASVTLASSRTGFRVPAQPDAPSTVPPAPVASLETNHPSDDSSPSRPVETPATSESVPTPAALEATAVAMAESATTPAVSVTVDRPLMRRAAKAEARGEKIAAVPGVPVEALEKRPAGMAKTFVSPVQQGGRVAERFVGTGVAKPVAEMSYALADHSSAAALASHAAPDWQHLQFDLSGVAEPQLQARDAVANVMSVIDAQEKPEATAHRLVSMDFDFGGERLAVRVEFRDGAVQAHFRTQSLELRSALASEWSHVASAPENILRAVEPVFVTSSRSEQAASFNADGGAPRQQQQAPASESNPSNRTGGARAAKSARAAASATTDATDALNYRRPFTTRHLHALA